MAADSKLPLVGEHIRQAIEAAADVPEYREQLMSLMSRPGRVLSRTGAPKWPALVLDVCDALGGDVSAATMAAAAVELAVAAIDVADDVIDDELDAETGTLGRAVNASVALSFLSQRLVAQLHYPDHPGRAGRISRLLAEGSLACCAGQDQDILLESARMVTEDEAYDMTRRKSGSLLAMASRVGAATASDDPQVIDIAGQLGEHIGVIAQLLNDVADVDPYSNARGSDLRLRKKTLPIAFALRCAQEEGLPDIISWFATTGALDDAEEARLASAIHDLGALHYTWVVVDAHRQRALELLQELGRLSGCNVQGLRRTIPAAHSRRPERRAA